MHPPRGFATCIQQWGRTAFRVPSRSTSLQNTKHGYLWRYSSCVSWVDATTNTQEFSIKCVPRSIAYMNIVIDYRWGPLTLCRTLSMSLLPIIWINFETSSCIIVRIVLVSHDVTLLPNDLPKRTRGTGSGDSGKCRRFLQNWRSDTRTKLPCTGSCREQPPHMTSPLTRQWCRRFVWVNFVRQHRQCWRRLSATQSSLEI